MRSPGLAILGVVAICLPAASCGPNPVIARDPVPQPPPGYKVECRSAPFLLSVVTSCTPVRTGPTREERILIRKG